MAVSADNLGKVLEAGEWLLKAFLVYVDESHVDRLRLFEESVLSSDDEPGEALAVQQFG